MSDTEKIESEVEVAEVGVVTPPVEVDVRIAQLEKERDDFKEQALRTLADFQNFRRRTQSEAALLRQLATESLVADLLPVLDNFERSLNSLETGASAESVIEGIKMVDRQLRTVLESVNLVRLYPAGQPFDPDHHEAIAVEASEEHEEDTVLHVLEAGYKLGERVIRPARVKVVKNS